MAVTSATMLRKAAKAYSSRYRRSIHLLPLSLPPLIILLADTIPFRHSMDSTTAEAIRLAHLPSRILRLSPSGYFRSCLCHCLAGNDGILFHFISLWRTSRHCLVTAYLNPLSFRRPRILRNGHAPGESRSK